MANYWKSEHERWATEWKNADSKKQYFLFRKLHGALFNMSQIIANRYFSISYAKQDLMIEEAINDVFLNLHKYDPLRQKAYTFCGTLIRNFYWDKEVRQNNHFKVELEYFDTYDYHDTSESMYEERPELDVQRVLKHLQALKTKIILSSGLTLTNLNNRLIVLDKCIEYLLKYENFDAFAVFDYCFLNTDINRNMIAYYIGKLFGTTVKVKDQTEPNPNYFQEDFLEGDVRRVRRFNKTNKKLDKAYNYF